MPLVLTKPLADLKAAAGAEVDRLAGEIRARYITVSPGQEVTYALKRAEAAAYIAAAYPADATAYPWIAAEATATGKTPAQAADRIAEKAAEWVAIGSQIEGARQAAKAAISAASSAADIWAAKAAFVAAVEGL
ncbi:hypothetical protein ACQE3E_06750 [Methylomonas sp. MED-D]|uniref:hypothetical protein n=1 Tax=Methylomonas sp. MED-D TaxID=3418768 RepID=UPI003D040E8E